MSDEAMTASRVPNCSSICQRRDLFRRAPLGLVDLTWGFVDDGPLGFHGVIDGVVSRNGLLDRARGLPAVLDRLEGAERSAFSQRYKGLAARARCQS